MCVGGKRDKKDESYILIFYSLKPTHRTGKIKNSQVVLLSYGDKIHKELTRRAEKHCFRERGWTGSELAFSSESIQKDSEFFFFFMHGGLVT